MVIGKAAGAFGEAWVVVVYSLETDMIRTLR
jgi:hypothetical protein